MHKPHSCQMWLSGHEHFCPEWAAWQKVNMKRTIERINYVGMLDAEETLLHMVKRHINLMDMSYKLKQFVE